MNNYYITFPDGLTGDRLLHLLKLHNYPVVQRDGYGVGTSLWLDYVFEKLHQCGIIGTIQNCRKTCIKIDSEKSNLGLLMLAINHEILSIFTEEEFQMEWWHEPGPSEYFYGGKLEF